MQAMVVMTQTVSIKNAMRANRSQARFSSGRTDLFDLKKEMLATSETTSESTAAKCPSEPGNKCSPV